ncbi:sigma-70 family RNA polymerase sigma factor [Rhodobium gokarnense]|uniref:RNA polymerase sigma-70 factor (ECF subfamily) n=1 Tax=Rhodobium gokarnense TaxID=364296 RepID=A0ABT3HC55_9HYPH|nr:sigma-70 family RNA polymerase sigma factor [Rhodobium gokarnense]MCW2307957.1 RNA polymerase sigma-70 factor (ECF subfamily) [Rhodobium gokarnense]
MPQAEDIEELLSRTALGDRDAFRLLYVHTSAKLFGVCLRLLKDKARAEDALQEVYVKIWSNASKYAPSGYSPISWLVAVARNHVIDILRAAKPEAVDIDDVPDAADDGPTPEQVSERRSTRRAIEDCLDELDHAAAEAVRSAYLDGDSYRELAERQDVPLNTMRTRLRRSLMKLRDCLER